MNAANKNETINDAKLQNLANHTYQFNNYYDRKRKYNFNQALNVLYCILVCRFLILISSLKYSLNSLLEIK